MRSVIVHVGMPKSGSTSIQAFLRRNATLLTEKAVHYPDRLVYPDGHAEYGVIAMARAGELLSDPADRHQIGTADLADQARIARELEERIEAALPDSGTVVLSSESLAYWLRSEASRGALHDWLAERFDAVGYLLVVRPMEGFIRSNYSEAVRRGLDEDFDRFVAIGNFQDMGRTALAWQRQFGDRLRVRLLPSAAQGREALYGCLVDLLGLSIEGMNIPRVRNASLTSTQALVLRRANRHFGPNCARPRRLQQLVTLARRGRGLRLGKPEDHSHRKPAGACRAALSPRLAGLRRGPARGGRRRLAAAVRGRAERDAPKSPEAASANHGAPMD